LLLASILIISAKFIAYDYYNKPLFLALIAGSLYILLSGFTKLFEGLFQASNNFKKSFYKEIIFQTIRLLLVPTIILLTINKVSSEILISLVIITLSASFLVSLIFIIISAKRQISFLRLETKKLRKREKRKLNKFILALSAVTLSGVFFGFIDMFILGRYVAAEFIGFYRVAFALITSATPFITFSGALFPLFSRLKGKQLTRGLNKSTRLTISIAIPILIIILTFSSPIVRIIFGAEYSPSANILRLFSPLIAIYSSYLISQNKPKRTLF